MEKKQLVSEALIWFLAGVVTLFAIGGVNLSFRAKGKLVKRNIY